MRKAGLEAVATLPAHSDAGFTSGSLSQTPSTLPSTRRSSSEFKRVEVVPRTMEGSRSGVGAWGDEEEAKSAPLARDSSKTALARHPSRPRTSRSRTGTTRNIRMSVVMPHTAALREKIAHRSMTWYSRLQSLFYRGKAYDKATKGIKYALLIMLYFSVISVMSETVRFEQDNTSWLEKPRAVGVKVVEVIMFLAWSIELGLRLWTVPVFPTEDGPGDPRISRLKLLVTPGTLFDITLMVPTFAWMIMPYTIDIFGDSEWARLLRIYRCFRVLKFVRYAPTVYTLWHVLIMKSEELITTASVLGTIVLLLALVVFAFENPENGEQFPNLVVSLWWAVITLTTVGYGDITPVSPFGRLFGSVGAVIGIGLFTLPAGVIASGYLEQRESQKADFRRLLTHVADTKRKKVLYDAFRRLRKKCEAVHKSELAMTRSMTRADVKDFSSEGVMKRLQQSARAVIAMHRMVAAPTPGSGVVSSADMAIKSVEESRGGGRGSEPDFPSAETMDQRVRTAQRLLELCGGNLEVAFSQVSGVYFVPRLRDAEGAPRRYSSAAPPGE